MGKIINFLKRHIETFSGNNRFALRIGGIIITSTLLFLSTLSGWVIEQLSQSTYIPSKFIGSFLLLIGLTSGFAAGSLRRSIKNVLVELDPEINDINVARNNLSLIVGRDVKQLNKDEIFRATAETASENSVDGIFAPLFWTFIGIVAKEFSPIYPGPLAFLWAFKSVSTIDSMLGYKKGNLKWLGTAGALLDDFLIWIPCRIVLITLPLISKPIGSFPRLIRSALEDGSNDNSPNSGISEAIFAYCGEVKMGGTNIYDDVKIFKPILAYNAPIADSNGVNRILRLSLKLELAWVFLFTILTIAI